MWVAARRTHIAARLVALALALALIVAACGTVMPRDVKGNDVREWDPPVTRLAWSGGSLVAALGWDAFPDRRWPMQGYATRYVSVDLQSGDVRTLGRDPDRVVRAVYLGHPVRCRISCDRAGACSVATPRGGLAMPGRCPPERAMAVACDGGRVVATCGWQIYVHKKTWQQVRPLGSWPWSIEITGRRAYVRFDKGEFGGCLGELDLETLKTRCVVLAADGQLARVSALESAPDGSLWVAEGWYTDLAVYRIQHGIVTREFPGPALTGRLRWVYGISAGAHTVAVLTNLGPFIEQRGRWTWVHLPKDVYLHGTCIAPGPFADDLVVGTGNNGVEVWDLFLGARMGHVRLRR